MEWMYCSYLPKIVNAAVEINLFDVLHDNSMTLAELSGKLNSHEEITEALLDSLVAMELLAKENGDYILTQTAIDFMRNESPASQCGTIRAYSGSSGPFDSLVDVLRKGPERFDNELWNSRQMVLDMEQQNMGGMFQAVLSFVKESEEFSKSRKMCDLAGNTGYYSFAFMEENPDLQSHVYDLPGVCALAREIKKSDKNYHRISYHETDIELADQFGEGMDFAFCSHFLYEANARGKLGRILKNLNKSMNPGSLFLSSHIPSYEEGGKPLMTAIAELTPKSHKHK
jgi:hypothetical protein